MAWWGTGWTMLRVIYSASQGKAYRDGDAEQKVRHAWTVARRDPAKVTTVIVGSESFIQALLTLIAEGVIPADSVDLQYAPDGTPLHTAQPIELRSNATLPKWPAGFIDTTYQLTRRRLEAQVLIAKGRTHADH